MENGSLYIALISIHGLIRGHDLELGRDPDTGGQTKYVIELAKALAKQPRIARVDLITRRIVDTDSGPDYAEIIEPLADKSQIVRIDAGPDKYVFKEELWDYLDVFADRLLDWLHRQVRLPNILHCHYADAAYVGVRLAHATGIPLVLTGHSLGRDKRRQLLAQGASLEHIEQRYRIFRRIDAEEEALSNADLIITSTRNEIEEQYALYDCYTPEKMVVIPPGTDLAQFHPSVSNALNAEFSLKLENFLRDPAKPMILALSRPDERKNIVGLLEAYGESPRLQALANLVIVAGNREDIRDLSEGPQSVLTELLLVADRYELYGRVAMPKHHTSDDVPEIYRLAAASRGVFVNPALTEPFGLTLLEAAACGLPLVATENGGPVDIIANCENGLLVDPLDRQAITDALLKILENPSLWQIYSENGLERVGKYYSWDAHAQAYLHYLKPLLDQHRDLPKTSPITSSGRFRNRAIFTAIDETLLGDEESLAQFCRFVSKNRKKFLFGVSTWRRLDSVLGVFKKHRIPTPDILVTSLGTEIYYFPQLIAETAWTRHIDHFWTPQAIRRVIVESPGIAGLRPAKTELSRFKLSYYYDKDAAPTLDEINMVLRHHEFAVNTTLSFGKYFDVVPARASKGNALRYIAQQWQIPLERILVMGGSGADADMLRGNTLGVVAANRNRDELAALGDLDQVYIAERPYALGILEAIEHYDFFNR